MSEEDCSLGGYRNTVQTMQESIPSLMYHNVMLFSLMYLHVDLRQLTVMATTTVKNTCMCDIRACLTACSPDGDCRILL